MKASDLLPKGGELPYKTISERLRIGGQQGLSYQVRIEKFLRGMHQAGIVEQIKKELLTTQDRQDPIVRRAMEHALANEVAPSPPGFSFQLRMIGVTIHDEIGSDPVNRHLYQNLVQSMHQHTVWAKYGLNVFNLTDGLISGLILTDPLPLEEENFQLPFPCFAIVIPPGYIPFGYRLDKVDWTQLIWVQRFASVEKDESIYQVTAECNGAQLFWRDPLARLNRTKCDSQLMVFEDDPAMNSTDDVCMTACMRVVRNLVSWINSVGLPKDEVTKTRKKKAHPKRNERSEAQAVPMTWILGREVKYGPEIRQSAKDAVQSLDKRRPPKDWQVKVRYIVRGHFRNQAHGPGHSERRRQWINPFWKGPEGAQAWSHLYQPNEPKEPEPTKE